MPTIQLPDYLQNDVDDRTTKFVLFEFDLRHGRLSHDDVIDFINRHFITNMSDLYETLARADVAEENTLTVHRDDLAKKDEEIEKLEKLLKNSHAEIAALRGVIRRGT